MTMACQAERSRVLRENHGEILSRALQGTTSGASYAETFGRLPDETVTWFQCYVHERDHLMRFLGTTYGQLLMFSTASEQKLFDSILQLDSGGSLLGMLCEPGHGRTVERLGTEWDEVRNILEPRNARNFADFPIRWDCYDTGVGAALATSSGDRPAFSTTDWDDLRSIRAELFAHGVIDAAAVFEFFAVQSENILMRQRLANADTVADLSSGGPYWRVVSHWERAFPGTSIYRELIPNDISGVFNVALIAAADLSLFPPIGPDGLVWDRPEPALLWDIDPGLRFVRIVRAMKTAGIDPMSFECNESSFLYLQEVVCRAFGWPTPDALCRLWRSESRPNASEKTTDVAVKKRHAAAQSVFDLRVQQPFATTRQHWDEHVELVRFEGWAMLQDGFLMPGGTRDLDHNREYLKSFFGYHTKLAALGENPDSWFWQMDELTRAFAVEQVCTELDPTMASNLKETFSLI